jgi:NitT/TauT family transport system substrate-binding protein
MTQVELDQARQALIDNGVVDGGDAALYGLGAMTETRWSALFEIVAETDAYPGNLDWRDAFTAAYLPGRG